VPAYAEELGRSSGTETFVALKAHVDNWRWAGVPFYLRTGKRLPERRTEIVIQFRTCRIRCSPARRQGRAQPADHRHPARREHHAELMAKQPGLDRGGIRLREVPLEIGMADAFADVRRRIAYERLLLDLIEGDPTLFVRRDEVEAQWQWIDGIRAVLGRGRHSPRPYAAGNWGPSAAIALIERDGRSWND
jgi:glucose-6-phosphate 1-dehydrogenase